MSDLERIRQTDCYQIAFTGDAQQPTARELVIQRGDKSYLINVTTADFLERLKAHNLQFDPSVRLDERFYIVGDLSSLEDVCQRLSQVPTEILMPYLTEQVIGHDNKT